MLKETVINASAYRFIVQYSEPVMAWEDDPTKPSKADGKPSRRVSLSDQDRDRDTGVPMWKVVTVATGTMGGSIEVVIPSTAPPAVEDGEIVTFTNLRQAKVFNSRDGIKAEYRAEAVHPTAAANGRAAKATAES